MSKGARILIAIFLGLLAALFGMLYLAGQKRRIEGGATNVAVYVAAQSIPANVELTPDMLTTREIPQIYLQPSVITRSEVADPTLVEGVTLVPIQAGEQIIRTKLWEGTTPPLSEDIPAGVVAISVSQETNAPARNVHANLQPRDRVDILAAIQFIKPPKEKFLEVRPLFYDVEVIAVDTTTPQSIAREFSAEGLVESDEDKKLETVTVLLPPADAQQLILAQELGSVWFILRGEAEYEDYRYETWDQDRFLQSQYRLWDEDTMEQQLAEQLGQLAARR